MLTIAVAFLLQVAPQTRADSSLADSARSRAQSLEGVQVNAVRGGSAPVSQKTLGRAELQRGYSGQETPILLQAAPGVTAYSESGLASNYSYLRLRGIDQTRINITLDGIPLNEPEDQSLFFSNFPDFANSISSVQVQRGVGSSSHGVAAYAGSVNFESIPIASVEGGAEAQLTAGAFNTHRGSLVYQSGLTASGFAGYVRGSAQETDGYRYNSGNRSRSLFASGGWFGTRDIVKLTLLAGLSSNDQAYYATPVSTLREVPRDNPFGNSPEFAFTDRFHQDLLSLAWTRALSPSMNLATTAYGFDAGGWYDFPGDRGNVDAYHYNLHSRWGGITSALEWRGEGRTAAFGLNASRYRRQHWLVQRPDLETRYHDNAGHKGEQSAFAKGSISRGRLTWSGDLQIRAVQFRYQPTAGAAFPGESVRWSFLNPKVGVTAALTSAASAYASVGWNGREPTRADMFAGADDVDDVTASSVFPLTRVRAERAYDIEAGITWRSSTVTAQANLFYMQFRHEIAAIGGVSELGYALRKNVDRSRRAGFEGDATWRVTPRLTLLGTLSILDARIRDYRDDATGLSYRNVTSVMSPRLVSGHGVRAELARWLSLDADGRYVSRMMLTNTQDARFATPTTWYADAGATFRAGRQSVLVQVRNVFNNRVYTGGYPGIVPGQGDPANMEAAYFILAETNISVTARISL